MVLYQKKSLIEKKFDHSINLRYLIEGIVDPLRVSSESFVCHSGSN